LELWNRFRSSLEPLEKRIEFWLFQMSSDYKCTKENLNRIYEFFEQNKLGNRAVIEFRDPSWWKVIKEIENTGSTFCSVDAPKLPNRLIDSNDSVYLRLHGSRDWYNYIYSKQEMNRILSKIQNLKADRKAIYLNNDHGMLKNGLYLVRKSKII
jgi:uncharacterized protein YecE (DUF72 family)